MVIARNCTNSRMRSRESDSASPSAKVGEDLVVGLELGVEGIVELASDAVANRRVKALAAAPDVSFFGALK